MPVPAPFSRLLPLPPLLWAVPLAILFTLAPLSCRTGLARAEGDAGQIERTIKEQQARASAGREEIVRLTAEERRLFQDLAGLEDKIGSLERQLAAREGELAAVQDEERRTLSEYDGLDRTRAELGRELDELLRRLWVARLRERAERVPPDPEGGGLGREGWAEADRKAAWLAELYRAVRQAEEKVQDNARRLDANLAARERLARDIREQLARIDRDKDGLLRDRLEFQRRLQANRARKLSREEELGQILAAINSLNYQIGQLRQLKSLAERDFDLLRGKLGWPTPGRVVSRFAPEASPPQRGIGLVVADNAPVRAVAWGKVVHNDTLRGFGRVVIVLHSRDYYSLYAFLGDSNVTVGQQVERNETIGSAGYYPAAKGSGLYFELRFRQKPINPEHWFIATK
jgi:murein DD-endopeptidase MepM/ murein hydrolase activator NlpD